MHNNTINSRTAWQAHDNGAQDKDVNERGGLSRGQCLRPYFLLTLPAPAAHEKYTVPLERTSQ